MTSAESHDVDHDHELTVQTKSGPVRGAIDPVQPTVQRYLGIPYATAPYSDDRFAMPRAHDEWTDLFEADEFGPTAPQTPYGGGLDKVLPTVIIEGDEVLNLNIWSRADAAGAPVMVWLHGGALIRGSNALESYDGATFARDGVIFVAINYRLGAEGFSVLDGAPVNLGIADQVAALRWVQDNIAAFGGDPSQVTVFGQSAGAGAVAALLAHPDAAGLFHRAIIQSGPLEMQTRKKAAKITKAMAKDLGILATREAFSGVTPADLLACQSRVIGNATPVTGGYGFGIVEGDTAPGSLPSDSGAALVTGISGKIPIMIGYTTEEHRLWFIPTGLANKLNWFHLMIARLTFKINSAAIKLYRRNRPGAPTGEIIGALATDLLLRIPKNNLLDDRLAQGTLSAPSWMYEFAWRTPVGDLGAAHALELGFVFDHLDAGDGNGDGFAGPGAPQVLADAMHSDWIRFASTGDPGWRAWDQSRPVMMYDTPAPAVVEAPREEERQALS